MKKFFAKIWQEVEFFDLNDAVGVFMIQILLVGFFGIIGAIWVSITISPYLWFESFAETLITVFLGFIALDMFAIAIIAVCIYAWACFYVLRLCYTSLRNGRKENEC